MQSVTSALFVRLKPVPGKEVELEDFLRSTIPLIDAEPETLAWFALQFEDGTYGIFDAFPDAGARNDHLIGKVAEALMETAPELLSEEPLIEKADVLASKLLP